MRSLLVAVLAFATVGAVAREPVVGLPCEGCEAVFDGLPSNLSPRSRIARRGEPGQPLVVTGRVLGPDGKPHSGVVIYAYQTNARGIYPPPGKPTGRPADRHGLLRGWAVSGLDGGYTFDTIRPGSYPATDIPAHIHMHVIEPRCATYYIDDIVFTDDPLLTAAQIRRHSNGRGGYAIATPILKDGQVQVTRDIRLGANIPGHKKCAGVSPPTAAVPKPLRGRLESDTGRIWGGSRFVPIL